MLPRATDTLGPVSPVRHNGQVNQVRSLSPKAAERLRERYPRSRVPRPVAIGLVATLALVGLGWLVWAGYLFATPQVDAQVATYVVRDDHTVAVTLTVERRDPSIAATCRIVAEAVDHSTVGEKEVLVPAGSDRLTNQAVEIRTLRRAITAVANECTSG
jgi:hypothetical protein